MSFYACVDAGTTRLKVALMNETGDILFVKSSETPVLRPFEGASELDMQALWEGLCALLRALREDAPSQWSALAGIGVCAQGDGLWALDENGHPVSNAILWNDTRAGGIERDHALAALARKHHSAPLFAGASPALLYHLKGQEPERYARIRQVHHCKDYLNYRLTGELVSDYTDQSAAGLNILHRTYVKEIFIHLDIEEMMQALPFLRESISILGSVSVQASKESGLPVGLPVAVGCMDTAAVAWGAGMEQSGDSCIILGTTLCCERLIDRAQFDMWDMRGSTLLSLWPDTYMRMMAAASGICTLDWAMQSLCSGLGWKEAEAAAMQRPDLGKLLFHPYLYGERAPFRESAACGGFYGLRAGHDRFHMLRAVYEGLALSVRDCMSALPAGEGAIYLCGGGAQSALLRQMIADALGKEVYISDCKEPGLRGAGMVAKAAVEGTVRLPAMGMGKMQPDAKNSEAFERKYEEYTALRGALLPYWREEK